MSAFSEKPGLREQMITALAGSQMTPVEGRECALDRIAAFGAAQIAPGPDVRGFVATVAPIAAPVPETHRVGGVSAYASCPVDPAQPRAAPLPCASADLRGEPDALPPQAPGDAQEDLQLAVFEPELAGLLLRLKYLDERALAAPAASQFARVLRRRHRRASPLELLGRVAVYSIAEWVCGNCPDCRGTGRRGATMGGVEEKLVACRTCERVDGKPSGMARVRLPGNQALAHVSCPSCCGRRTMVERKRVRGRLGEICRRCAGSGHFFPHEMDRADALGIDPATYRRRWAAVFDAALRSVRALDRRLMGSVREQLGRDLGSVA